MRLYQKCKLLLLLPDYTDITNATYKIAAATPRLYQKCILQIDAVNAICKLLLLLQD